MMANIFGRPLTGARIETARSTKPPVKLPPLANAIIIATLSGAAWIPIVYLIFALL